MWNYFPLIRRYELILWFLVPPLNKNIYLDELLETNVTFNFCIFIFYHNLSNYGKYNFAKKSLNVFLS